MNMQQRGAIYSNAYDVAASQGHRHMVCVGVAYFAPLVCLPEVIGEPGFYKTRCGEIVRVESASRRHAFACHGVYSEGVAESWHCSGRLYAQMTSANDIVGQA